MSKYKFIFSYSFLMNFILIFGNYYDLRRSARIHFMSKLYCILFGASNVVQVLSVLDLSELGEYMIAYQLIILTHFAIIIALLLLIKPDDFSESSLLISDIDHELGLSCSDLKSYIPMSILTIGFFVQCSGFIFYTTVPLFSMIPLLFFLGIIRALTLISSVCPLIMKLDWYWNRLKILRKMMKVNLKSNNQEEKITYVKKFLNVYNSISRYLRVAEKRFSYLIGLNIMMVILKLWFFIFYVLDSRHALNSLKIVMWITQLSFEVFVQFVPALLMELSADELDEIKAALADDLIECEDNDLCTVLYDALDYIQVCPAIFLLWPNLPLNLNLVLGFIGLCSTYTISLLQFKY